MLKFERLSLWGWFDGKKSWSTWKLHYKMLLRKIDLKVKPEQTMTALPLIKFIFQSRDIDWLFKKSYDI